MTQFRSMPATSPRSWLAIVITSEVIYLVRNVLVLFFWTMPIMNLRWPQSSKNSEEDDSNRSSPGTFGAVQGECILYMIVSSNSQQKYDIGLPSLKVSRYI